MGKVEEQEARDDLAHAALYARGVHDIIDMLTAVADLAYEFDVDDAAQYIDDAKDRIRKRYFL